MVSDVVGSVTVTRVHRTEFVEVPCEASAPHRAHRRTFVVGGGGASTDLTRLVREHVVRPEVRTSSTEQWCPGVEE